MKRPDIIAALEHVIEVFENLGIGYYIGGSVASSAYGIARATMDIDLVANLEQHYRRDVNLDLRHTKEVKSNGKKTQR